MLGVIASLLPPGTLISLVAVPLAIRVHRGLARHYDEPYTLIPALTANIALHLVVGLGMVAGYVLKIVLT